MATTVIEVNNLGKQYRLGQVGQGTMADDLKRFLHKMRGKEDPFLKIGETNDRSKKGDSDFVWALKDINFKVNQGEVLGIIGKNGAGKSTLLKILSRTTLPTVGEYKIKGRIASLLEVGTGFHPDLTGRENIFLNGAILGMTKAEIKKHFDEIVDFSGVERYIDTPVKRYSSGMYVRLAFAVAAHLKPEILIVDEVLAVGDAEFQKKCLGKMKDVSGEGRTVLFVSHNMIAVQGLCTNALILEKGRLEKIGETGDIINKYLSKTFIKTFERIWELENAPGNDQVKITKAKFIPQLEKEIDLVTINTPLLFEFEFINFFDDVGIVIAIEVHSINGLDIFTSGPAEVTKLQKGTYKTTCIVPSQLLNDGTYTITVQIVKNGIEMLHREIDILVFEVNDSIRPLGYTGKWPGVIRPKLNWTMNLISK
jgi:lipopolysaccharide transport system ATP-binding protein